MEIATDKTIIEIAELGVEFDPVVEMLTYIEEVIGGDGQGRMREEVWEWWWRFMEKVEGGNKMVRNFLVDNVLVGSWEELETFEWFLEHSNRIPGIGQERKICKVIRGLGGLMGNGRHVELGIEMTEGEGVELDGIRVLAEEMNWDRSWANIRRE